MRNVALANSGPVGEEDHIELAALGDLRAARVMLDMQRAVGWHIRMTPGGRVVTVVAYRQAKPHFKIRHRSVPSGNIARRIRESPDPRPCSTSTLVGSLAGSWPHIGSKEGRRGIQSAPRFSPCCAAARADRRGDGLGLAHRPRLPRWPGQKGHQGGCPDHLCQAGKTSGPRAASSSIASPPSRGASCGEPRS